jgi:hypothetical protein
MTDPRTEIPELPSERSIDRVVSLLEPISRVIQPQLYGVEHLPADGSLLVGNDTIYGLLDVPFMMAEIWKHGRLASPRPGRAGPLRGSARARPADRGGNGARNS